MLNIRKKSIVSLLVISGLLAVFCAAFFNSEFVSKYISLDYFVSTRASNQINTYRVLLTILGVLITMIGSTIATLQSNKLLALKNWLIFHLKRESVAIILIFLGGSILRSFHLLIVGTSSPYKYGGLFLEFANQIIQNGFLLPYDIPFYTNGGIPFAYPPFPFYVEAFAIHFLKIPPFAIVNILPSFIAIISLPFFYMLTRAGGLSRGARLIALTAFTFMPNAFFDQIKGSGLAEAFGMLAIICFFSGLLIAYKHNRYSDYIIIGISWALCVVSSPGSAYASVLCFLTFSIALLLRGNPYNIILRLMLAGILALFLSSPYWFVVIKNHGIGVFMNSLAGQHSLGNLIKPIRVLLDIQFEGHEYSNIWNFIILMGLLLSFIERRFLLLGWFVVLVSIPRESAWLSSIPSAILIGSGSELIVSKENMNLIGLVKSRTLLMGVTIWMILSTAIGPLLFVLNAPFSSDSSLEPEHFEAMHWIYLNTTPDSKVIVVSEPHVQEWLPQISRREVINMPYGSEWQPNERVSILQFEEVLKTCRDLSCVSMNSQTIFNVKQFVLFVEKDKLNTLIPSHFDETDYQLLWENKRVSILMASVP